MKEPESVGSLLRRLRQEAGLTLTELAARAGVDKANISRLETGQAPRSTMGSLTKLAAVLQVDPDQLYKAAGINDPGTVLPSFRPYLRAKYGHLPPEKLDELAQFFETIESEQAAKKSKA